jgi:DNA ligase D-like protein (predicted ligase)/DNA ligase D-like protein (predicted 3'-phosphoesterase)/DNA ligase D-like protein (predicted polymerase)
MPARTTTRRTRRITPPAFAPMAATLVDRPFDHPDWVFEPKFDDLRVQVRFDGRSLSLLSRNDKPQEVMFPDVAAAMRVALKKPAVLDGEVVCFDEHGKTSFRALQQRFHLTDPDEIAIRVEKYPASIFLFDVLWLAGSELTGEPLSERKRLLRTEVRWSDRVRWTETHEGEGTALFRAACRRGDEGIVGKLLTSRYVGRRDPAWVKIKCISRQEFVIGGFTDTQRSRVGIGALLVGYYDRDRFVYAGKVGTGYTRETLLDLREKLGRIEGSTPPFEEGEPPAGPGVHWVRPAFVAEIGFAEWTRNGLLRQPRFEGLRTDKNPRDCRRERPRDTTNDITEAGATMPATKKKAALAALDEYDAKRDFEATPEPAPAPQKPHKGAIFVIQEHHATRLHYDFRLETGGVLKSWAVTNEPSLDPAVKRLAVRVEDHPVVYATFHDTIPEGHYGAGEVFIWDHGTYENLNPANSITEGIEAGKLSFALHGTKLKGRFSLVRMHGRGGSGKRENWLLIKGRDGYARPASAATTPQKAARRVTTKPAAVKTTADGKPPKDVEVTNPDKVLFPDEGYTKADVAAFYRKVAPRLLPILKDRPVTLERLPDGLGAGKPNLWQKHTPDTYPGWIPRVELETERGRPVKYVLVNDLPTLLYLVNQGALTFHPWLSRVGSLDRPDFVLFDLDPGSAPFADVVIVAMRVHEELTAEGREAVVKTSGKSGLHVLVRWTAKGDYGAARKWALAVAGRVAAALPDLATTEIL